MEANTTFQRIVCKMFRGGVLSVIRSHLVWISLVWQYVGPFELLHLHFNCIRERWGQKSEKNTPKNRVQNLGFYLIIQASQAEAHII